MGKVAFKTGLPKAMLPRPLLHWEFTPVPPTSGTGLDKLGGGGGFLVALVSFPVFGVRMNPSADWA